MENNDFIVGVEPMDDALIEELSKLLPNHYEEVARKDLFKRLNPDWEFYKTADRNGVLKVFTARVPNTTLDLIGYWFFFIRCNPHYKDVVSASDDIIFVSKEYRGSRVKPFMQICLDTLKTWGVQTVVIHCKVAFDLEPLYSSLGFEPFEKNFIRRL